MIDLRIALYRVADLHRATDRAALRRQGYLDGERRPPVTRHWANR